ncbi:hypothetical protein FC62_GL001526 [Amylolactobacillus amylotrophicus DSM 20534]|uniref:Uncharacterized protein n=2 Tax=Amylolactobacillus TaxID=2767876 RepID=A0A0R1YH36_9LACO|nr:hypothetical protein FC62_GL001526 [Amylolactobacillus amylotrophicus DSM 20534]KRM41471.1 hypothetical protein FD40_GL001309 [Amylolactobacillus amylophilus DSM 20533 = JCM 1125]
MDFVTVIGFEDIIYNFQNQGLGTITTWILMLFLFVIPYEMMVGHLPWSGQHAPHRALYLEVNDSKL